MSEFLERLSRFTPDGSALERDALLFAAGQAAGRRGRGWKTLAATLAVTQVLSLALLWPRSELPQQPAARPVEPAIQSEMLPGEPPGYLKLRDQALVSEGNLKLPVTVDNLAPADPPLHAFSATVNDLLN
jgi:hypothetical protein